MKVSTIKKLSKKSLSVFLSIVMLMSTMSVCFGTIAFAAGGTVSDYAPLAEALNKDAVKNAKWTKETNHYTVSDSDGSVLAAVEAYWSAFNTLANKSPVTGNPNNTSNSTGSTESNRTINQVNETIKAGIKAHLSTEDYNAVQGFLTNLVVGLSVNGGTGATLTVGGDTNTTDNKNLPANNLSAIPTVTITVMKTLAAYTLDNLPDTFVASKSFTISHANDKYDYTYKKGETTVTEGSGCNAQEVTKDTFTRTYKFFYYISATSTSEGAAISTSVIPAAKETLAANADYFTKTLTDLVAIDTATLNTVKSAVNGAKNSVVSAFGEAAWDHFLGDDYDVAALSKNIDDAIEIAAVKVTTDKLTALVAAGYAGKSEAELRTLHSTLTTGLATFDAAGAEVRAYLGTNGFNREAVQAFADAVNKEIKLIELRALKATIDAEVSVYDAYTEETIVAGTVTGADLSYAKGRVDGFVKSIATYNSAFVAEAGMADYTATLNALSAKLSGLIQFSGYNDQFSAEYAKYVAEIYGATDLNAASADIVAALKGDAANGIQGYDAWYTGLKGLIATIESALGKERADKILKDNDDAMKAHMDSVYTTLYSRVDAEIDNATVLYAAIQDLGGEIDIITVSTYSVYKQAYKTLDRDTYNFLKDEATHFTMPQETIDKYEALKEDFTVLENFLLTGGFSSFNQIFGKYITRDVFANDIVRDEPFYANKAKLEELIGRLDNAITSDELGALLGGLLATEGDEAAAFDIAELVKGLIADALFSDATINSIVPMLYSLIMDMLIGIFEDGTLPTYVDEAGGVNITYNMNLAQVTKAAGLYIFPADIATCIDGSKYPDVKAAYSNMSSAYDVTKEDLGTGKFKVTIEYTPWTKLVNEEGALEFEWGVDAAKEAGKSTEEVAEAFYQAFDDALHTLKPLLNVLLANKEWSSNTVNNVAHAQTSFLLGADANLTLKADACPGYANLIVPIFEALGGRVKGTSGALFEFNSPETIKGYADSFSLTNLNDNTAANMLRDIINPLFDFIDVLGGAPLSTVISILPNLCYALSMQMVPALLGKLGTTITPSISTSGLLSCANSLIGGLIEPIKINVDELLGDFNTEVIDLSGGVNSLLALVGLPIPPIPQGEIAQMGEMSKFTSARYATHYDKAVVNETLPADKQLGANEALTVVADKGAVMMRLLQYIFSIIEDEEAFAGLLGMLITKDVPALDADGNEKLDEEGNVIVETVPDEAQIAEILTTINDLGIIKEDNSLTLAALIELLAPDKLDIAEMEWYESSYAELGTTSPENVIYLLYNNDWTKEKADSIADNLVEIINEILVITGSEETDVNAMLKGLVNDGLAGAFTTETLTTLILGIAGMGKDEMDPMLADLLAGILEADFAEMYKAFGYLLPVEEAEEDADDPEIVAEGEEEEEAPAPAPLKPGEEGYVNTTGITAVLDAEDNIIGWTIDGTEFVDGDRATFIKIAVRALGAFIPTLTKLLTGENISALGLLDISCIDGYSESLALIFEALGIAVPSQAELEAIAADETLDRPEEAAILAIADAVFAWLEGVFAEDADTVTILANLIPELLYFIESNGLSVVVRNLLHPVLVLIDTVRPVIDIDLNGILSYFVSELVSGAELTLDTDALLNMILTGELPPPSAIEDYIYVDINVKNIKLSTVLNIVDAMLGTKLATSPLVSPGFDALFAATEEYTAANGDAAYRPIITLGDTLTVILSALLDSLDADAGEEGKKNGDVIFELIAELTENEAIAGYYPVIARIIKGFSVEYTTIDWAYMYEDIEDGATALEQLAAADGKFPVRTGNAFDIYTSYKNNWTETTIDELNAVLDSFIQNIMVLAKDGQSLGSLLDDAITNGLYTESILNSLIELVVGAVIDYEGLITKAGVLLGAESIAKWFSDEYIEIDEAGNVTCIKDWGFDEATTNAEKRAAFVEGFVTVLEPAYEILAWLLFGDNFEFFVASEGGAIITINGGEGYEKAFVPLLEALGATMGYEGTDSGIKPAEAFYVDGKLDMETAVRDVFTAVTDVLAAICGDLQNPAENGAIGTMLNLLPNVIYFINAGGLKVVVNNLLAPVKNILAELEVFGLEVDFDNLIEGVPLTKLDWYGIFGLLESLLPLYFPGFVQEFLATFYIGKAESFVSANGETAYRIVFTDEETRADFITIVISFIADAFVDERNADTIKGWFGAGNEGIYDVIVAYLTNNSVIVPIQEFNWLFTESADTGDLFTPVTMDIFYGYVYGEIYTREMGEYIEKWLPSFVDSMIVLLGVQDAQGVNYEGLEDVLDTLIGSTVYKTENVAALYDMLTGLIGDLKAEIGEDFFNQIADVLYNALGVDVNYLMNVYQVPEIAEGDREAFVEALLDMLTPVYPILEWLLTSKDIAFFHSADPALQEKNDRVVLPGAEGYAYGIIPLMEALGCENVLTPDEYKAAVAEDKAALLRSIVNPILDKVDALLADPLTELTELLPGVIYFVNSNGLDTVIKNTANAVFSVLETIQPVLTEKLDIYELIGLDLTTLNLNTLIDELLAGVEEDTGLELRDVALDAINELTVGEIVSFTSKNGLTAYTMKYANGADRADMITVLLRFVLTFVAVPENVVALEAMLEGQLDEEGYKFLCSLLENFSQMAASDDGMDEIMYTVYEIFYAANVAAHSTEDWLAEFNGDYSFLNQLFATSNLDFLRQIEVSLGDLLNKYTGDIIDDDEIVPNGFIAFFQKIAEFFQKIGDFFRNLFK